MQTPAAAQKGQTEGRKLPGAATMALSSDVSPVLIGTVSQETKMRGSIRRNLSLIPALFWVSTIDFPETQIPSGPRIPRPPGKPIERQSQTSAQLAIWGPAPVEIGWLFPRRLKSWDSKRPTFRAPSSRPSFGSLPGQIFLLQVWISD